MDKSNNTISNNSDFLFLYEAIQCNPNGDIDQENRPRMDYDNDINLVSDVRVKRYIRDFFIMEGKDVFVDMEGGKKVSPDSKLKAVLTRLLDDESEIDKVLEENKIAKEQFEKVKKENKEKPVDEIIAYLQKNKKDYADLNKTFLAYLVKQKFLDIRLFGSAFAIEGFTKSYIGPVQLNWGYSLHKVKVMDSSSIVTIMNDDNSTIGKDYRVHYSLLAFHGSVNKYAAISTALTEEDMEEFRKAIWSSIPALPTRSKLDQFPKLYVEIIYNEGYYNGHFGDLRQYVSANTKDNGDQKSVRKFTELNLDLSKLKKLLEDNKCTETDKDKVILDYKIKTSSDLSFDTSNNTSSK